MNSLHKTHNFYTKYSKGFGPEGQGVLYTYEEVDKYGNIISSKNEWDVKNNITRHGFYYGSGCITLFGRYLTPRKYGNYNFDLEPLDMTDAIAREHDLLEHDNKNKTPWDLDYIYADIIFVSKLQTFLEKVENNPDYIDPFTGRKPSEESIEAARNAIDLFSVVIVMKEMKLQEAYEKGEMSKKDYEDKSRAISIVKYAASKAPLPEPKKTDK